MDLLEVRDEPFAFAKQALHARGFATAGLLAHRFENAFQATNLLLGLVQVLLKGTGEIFRGGRSNHFGQGFGDLVFGIVQLVKLPVEQIFEFRIAHNCSDGDGCAWTSNSAAEMGTADGVGFRNAR